MSLQSVLGPPSQQRQPVVSTSVPLTAFNEKVWRRILSVQLVIELTGGIQDPRDFEAYVKVVDKWIDGGFFG
jgi:hypothetical protein